MQSLDLPQNALHLQVRHPHGVIKAQNRHHLSTLSWIMYSWHPRHLGLRAANSISQVLGWRLEDKLGLFCFFFFGGGGRAVTVTGGFTVIKVPFSFLYGFHSLNFIASLSRLPWKCFLFLFQACCRCPSHFSRLPEWVAYEKSIILHSWPSF